ncbi:benzoate-coenzyme A ligase [gut metagenome]|uniref:Benzoate-coenzyme A ligase n=1 Tax=gut metagenome TaxID=749906 RepID=J9GEJ7_9ZZZZ
MENITLPFSLKDRGSIDANGHLHFLGRTDDIVSVNGIKVSAAKVEAALLSLAEIEDVKCLVFHKDDADILTAFISGAKKLGRQELVERLRAAELTDYEIPKQFMFMTSLPKNESGKIE